MVPVECRFRGCSERARVRRSCPDPRCPSMAARSLLSVGLVVIGGALSLAGSPGPVAGASVRTCDLIPGRSVPASMPPDIDLAPDRPVLAMPAATGDPDDDVVERQGRILLALARVVERRYLYPEVLEAWGNDALLPAA